MLELEGHSRHPRLELAAEPELRRLVLDLVLQVQLGVAGHLSSSNRRRDGKVRADEAASRVEQGASAAAAASSSPGLSFERLFHFWRQVWTSTTHRRSKRSGSRSGKTSARSTSTTPSPAGSRTASSTCSRCSRTPRATCTWGTSSTTRW